MQDFGQLAASRASFSDLQAKGIIHSEDLPREARDGRQVAVEFVSNVIPAMEGQWFSATPESIDSSVFDKADTKTPDFRPALSMV